MIRPQASRRLTFVVSTLLALGALQYARMLGAQDKGSSTNARVDRLALEVERAEAVRAVKELQHAYAQYAQFGLWNEMASLFAERAQFINGKDTIQGRAAIGEFFFAKFGEGKPGLPAGDLRTHLAMRPLINLAADGESVKGRWWEFSMLGRSGVSAEWAAGIYENEYVKEQGVWKIALSRYNPMFAGPYETGWRNVDADQKIVPYHFTTEETGIPVPAIPAGMVVRASTGSPDAHLITLERRIAVMNDEDKVRNLQNAYGYYIDRKMWDDVTDLFTTDGVLEIQNVGIYDGVKGIRRALERSGPVGLKHGEANDHLQFDTMVTIEPGGMEARARGIQFAMLGEADKGESYLSLSVFENRYVKQNDVWRIREMRIFPLRKTDYRLGWAKSVVVDPAPAREFAPDRAIPASDAMTPGAIPAFFKTNPATGKPVSYPTSAKLVATERLLSAPQAPRAPASSIPAAEMDARIREAERKLAVSKAYDGTENVSSAYGDYLDDLDFGKLAQIFAINGVKEIPFSGFYVGRESIARRDSTSGQGAPARARTSLSLHLRTQPVILVASDGRSSSIRTRLFQPGSSRTNASGLTGSMYNDQAILENGSWKLWSVAIDEPYVSWSAASAPARGTPQRGAVPQVAPTPQRGGATPQVAATPQRGGATPQVAATPQRGGGTTTGSYPPDIPLTVLGEREKGFRGGSGDVIAWPSILPMWFHYRNPVSGRVPELYWPDCVTCAYAPQTSMKNHGYLLPPQQ